MKANPGGQIDTRSVVGRGPLIEFIWETVEQQSVIKTAERRIGKTTVIKKMLAEPRPGWIPVFQDLEKYHSAADFALAVYHDIHHFLSRRTKVARRAKALFGALGGTEVGGFLKLPPKSESRWKDILTSAVEDLMHERDPDGDRLLFLWDEMPFMLANIRDRESEETAMEVLDVLRALRQSNDGLRMIMTGSIGLHHILRSLKDRGYQNSPVNDMAKIDVPALNRDDACKLALQLIEGESLASEDKEAAAQAIAGAADAFPFYIHHIVKGLKMSGDAADPEHVAAVVRRQLVDANDPWELSHYRERIPNYYGRENEQMVLHVLDELAVRHDAASIDEVLRHLKNISEFDGREALLDTLQLLERDHYLLQTDDGRYAFRFPLIERWWRIKRGLESGTPSNA